MNTIPFRGRRAFSLVEVAISLGILAFAIIPLVALLSIGFSGYRSAMDAMTQTALIRHVASVVAVHPESPPAGFYFSDAAAPVPGESGAAYFVSIVNLTGGSLSPEDLPSALDGGRTHLKNLRRISYDIHDVRGARKLASGGFQVAERDE